MKTVWVALVIGLALAVPAVAVAGASDVPASAARPQPKLSARDFDRLGSAARTAMLELGNVQAHGCKPDAIKCMNAATSKEIAADVKAASVARSLLPKLLPGKCRRGVAAHVSTWQRRAALVRTARAAWREHRYKDAADAYYSEFWNVELRNTVVLFC